MITPTVGRIVHYFEAPEAAERAALVCGVNDDQTLNLAVFDNRGYQDSRTNVTLVQDGEPAPDGCHCKWMPYQSAQAAKAEAAA